MRRIIFIAALGLCLLSPKLPAIAGVDEKTPTAAGVWQQVGDDGKVGALVTISEEDGVYVGRLSRLFLDPGDDPNPICTECPGDKRNRPILGLVFIEGMKQSGLDYEDGTILDPETGKIYHATMRLSPDGTKLTVRGYVGLEIFGRSQTWTRVE
ncbi:DUF2147 domain-containing protein [Methyloceanibacter sp.]|uniref:DUF2147 domain-containing protein n=1 Tax=Methyloceanibacter sp. TaxID=1965321 RepID=UPI002D5C420D|nr:DUF2147 domain-containing protein [Methyloceanibacter sp.]HZP07787.1 DUF2147 domain-containing protein [Methyloceanibacter sp.]